MVAKKLYKTKIITCDCVSEMLRITINFKRRTTKNLSRCCQTSHDSRYWRIFWKIVLSRDDLIIHRSAGTIIQRDKWSWDISVPKYVSRRLKQDMIESAGEDKEETHDVYLNELEQRNTKGNKKLEQKWCWVLFSETILIVKTKHKQLKST